MSKEGMNPFNQVFSEGELVDAYCEAFYDNPGCLGFFMPPEGDRSSKTPVDSEKQVGMETERQKNSLDSKHVRLERNRLAQRKFRTRQKAKIEEMERKLVQQREEIQRLTSENVALKRDVSNATPKDCATVDSTVTRQVYLHRMGIELGTESSDGVAFEAHDDTYNYSCILDLHWRRFAEDVQASLRKYQGISGNKGSAQAIEAIQNLRVIVDTGIEEHAKEVLSQHSLLCGIRAQDRDTKESQEAIWISVVQSMRLQNMQIKRITTLWNALVPKVESNIAMYTFFQERLQVLLTRLQSRTNISVHYIDQLNDAVSGAKKCLHEKQALEAQFLVSLCVSVLDPVQMATCIAGAYPDYPNISQMVAIVQEIGSQAKESVSDE